LSVEPCLFSASTNGAPWGASEYEWAGFIKDEPIEVVSGPETGLPLPARAELVVEGEVPPPSEETRKEGPFGEFTGYYAGGEKMEPVIRVRALYHRTNPVLHGEPPLKPPVETLVCPPSGSSTLRVWEGLEKSGIPGIKGVYNLSTGGGLVTVVSIKQQYAGHAVQVGRVASGLMHTICRVLVVVDEDIDPSNAEEVLWAIATRTDPENDFEIQRGCPSSPLDPMIPPERKKKRQFRSSRALIVACRPWDWMSEFPAVSRASEESRRKTYEKWRPLFE
jgi:4-hydroxy-3-polyprenylbenzoate decarboxylase